MPISIVRCAILAAAVFSSISALAAPSTASQSEENEDARSSKDAAWTPRRPRRTAEERGSNEPAKGATKSAAIAAVPTKYPSATRSVPVGKATAKGSKVLQAILRTFNENKSAEARASVDAFLAEPAWSPYEKAFAAQLGAQIAIQKQDYPGALKYAEVALTQNSLDNDAHFGLMLQRAQILMMQKDYAGALSGVDRFLAESGSTEVEPQVTRGNALYRLGRYAEAAAVLKPVVSADPSRADLQQLLADALARSGNAGEATRYAEAAAQKNPADKQARFNLVQNYLQNKQVNKAAEVLQSMRKDGQLTDDGDYRQLFAIYANIEGKEVETAEIINEGFAKGVLKRDYSAYLALAQSYYFSNQVDKAIEAYRKAAEMGKDGEAYLALARVLHNEQRTSESKAAAQLALSKGLKRPEEAKKILALPTK